MIGGKRKVTWLKGNAHGVIPYLLDDFLMNGRVADNPFFANLFPASLKLGLDQADDLAVLSKQISHREQYLGQGDKGNVDGGKAGLS